MEIFFLEANGKTNTGGYVKNICDAVGQLQPRVFTSRSNFHGNNSIRVFGKYGSTKYIVLKVLYYLIGWYKIKRQLKKASKKTIIIFHTHWFRLSPVDYHFLKGIKTRNSNIRLVHTVHNLLPHEPKFYDHRFHDAIYRMSDLLIFHNSVNITDFNNKFQDIKTKKIRIPHYAYRVDIDKKNKVIPKSILFFGNIRPYKGLEILIEAVRDLDCYVTVAGQPEYNIDEIVRRNPQIRFELTWISDDRLKELFSTHAIVVLPYKDIDNSGLVYLAMSYGKVVVASDLNMFKEIISDRVNGLLFEKNNSEDLQSKLHEFLENPDLLCKIGQNAKNLMGTEYSLSNIGDKLVKAYVNI